jgi:soluble lytic murein transglycosylase-like protein
MENCVKALLVGMAVLATSMAYADVYVFTDENGVASFSNVPVDERYELLISSATEESADDTILNPNMLAQSAAYNPIIENAASSHDMEAALLRAVIVVESGFDERAVSRAGAQGLMQLMPATAKQYGVSDAFDPSQNVQAGAQHLRGLIDRYGNDLELALAAYNAGEDAVERYGRKIPPFNETRRYVPKVLKIYNSLLERDPRT